MEPLVYLLKQVSALVILVILVVLWLLSRNKAVPYRDELEQYGFRFSFLAPVGLYIYEKIPWRFDSYNRKLRTKIAELFGMRHVDTYFEIHIAQKIVLTVGLLSIFGMLSLLGEVDKSFCFFAALITVLIFYWTDTDLDKKLKRRKRDILIDLTGFINTLALMLNAGLPFSSAVQKVVRDADRERPLYRELNYMLAEINSGKPVNRAYEDLAYRCKVPEVTRFISTVLQNLHRGNRDMVYVMINLTQEAWEKRKDIARKQGEEASSKLIFPMVMIFIAVAIIVLAPAIQAMGR